MRTGKKASARTKNSKAKPKTPTTNKTTSEYDIISLIKADHKPLKTRLGTLQNLNHDISIRRKTYHDFALLLECHSRCEEKALYSIIKTEEIYKLRADAYEAEVEHGLADKLVEEIDQVSDSVKWSAKVKVLAEIVEHHLNEEENELLPRFKKNSSAEERIRIGHKYLAMRSRLLKNMSEQLQSVKIESSIEMPRAL